jgi:hypothetical protein
VQFTVRSPGFAATDVPINSGGPTAEINVDSLGSSLGYAALPDPGQFATTVPGTAAGLFSTGAGGLPPMQIPTPPGYPLFVATDAGNNPRQVIGEGPYTISSESKPGSGHASAAGGFEWSSAGNAGLATSTASVGSDEGGAVVSTATSRVQGLAIGPVTFGEVLSVATERLGADGRLVPTSALEIAGMRVGALPVSITEDQLHLPGPSYPVPFNASIANLLKSSGISMQVATAQVTKTGVVAPALIITAPASIAGFTDGGTATWVIGAAQATMEGNAIKPASNNGVGAVGPAAGSGSAAGQGANLAGLLPSTSAPTGGVLSNQASAVNAPPSSTSVSFDALSNEHEFGLVGIFGVKVLYLLGVLAALAVLGLGQLIQYRGVRRQWNSGVG